MPNQMSPLNGQSLALPLMVDPDNVAYVPAAGDDLGVPTGGADATAPTLVQLYARGTLTNRSGSITAGGTAQQLAAANLLRRYLFVLNLHASADLWINFTTTAVADQPSIRLPAGASFVMEGSFVSTELVSVISGTTGAKFTAKEG